MEVTSNAKNVVFTRKTQIVLNRLSIWLTVSIFFVQIPATKNAKGSKSTKAKSEYEGKGEIGLRI